MTVVGDREIRRLNRDYLGRDKTTNVISFSMTEGDFGNVNPQLLGDVVICAATAAREAEAADIPYLDRLCFLLLHGILHLAGYDHERSGEDEAARMEAKEQEIWGMLKREEIL